MSSEEARRRLTRWWAVGFELARKDTEGHGGAWRFEADGAFHSCALGTLCFAFLIYGQVVNLGAVDFHG